MVSPYGYTTGLFNILYSSPNSITFNWNEGKSKYDERIMVVVYDIKNSKVYCDPAAAERSAGSTTINFNNNMNFSGKEVHIYIAFVSEDRKNQSTSQYLGRVVIL